MSPKSRCSALVAAGALTIDRGRHWRRRGTEKPVEIEKDLHSCTWQTDTETATTMGGGHGPDFLDFSLHGPCISYLCHAFERVSDRSNLERFKMASGSEYIVHGGEEGIVADLDVMVSGEQSSW